VSPLTTLHAGTRAPAAVTTPRARRVHEATSLKDPARKADRTALGLSMLTGVRR